MSADPNHVEVVKRRRSQPLLRRVWSWWSPAPPIPSPPTDFPPDITLQVRRVSPGPVAYGGYADIYSGKWKNGSADLKVAIKVLRVRTVDPAGEKLLRQLRYEISVWKRLSHPNIHVLCGLYEGLGPAPAMVSPWYTNGDINAYVARRAADPEVDTLKLKLFLGTSTGLAFLHDSSVVHGDIKGGNILISDDGTPQLCDFGLSRLLMEHSQSITHTGTKGTTRWMAPELVLDGERHTYASDVWAMGCLLLEVWSALRPYYTKKTDQQVFLALGQREAPARPTNVGDFPWSVAQGCCNFDPTSRPSPVRLMADVNLHMLIPRLSALVTGGHPRSSHDLNLLGAIEKSLPRLSVRQAAYLHEMTEPDLMTMVVRVFCTWSRSQSSPRRWRLYKDAVYRWCLKTVGHAEGNVGDNDDHSPEVLHPPSTIRPLARLLAAISPSLADKFMIVFSAAAVGDPITFPDTSRSVAWFPDNDRIAVCIGDGTVHIWNVAAGTLSLKLTNRTRLVRQVAISPNGKLLVSCSIRTGIRLWDAETGRAIGVPMTGLTDSVRSVAFSPDGRYIASGTEEKTICIWRTDTSADMICVLRGHEEGVCSVAYSPDGSRLVSGSWDMTIRVWDTRTWRCILGPIHAHAKDINCVAFSPDGLRIASGSDDCTIRIWNARTGDPVGDPLEGHADIVRSVAYSPDGTRIASGSDDRTIHIWNAATGALVQQPLCGHSNSVYSLAFSADGRRLASASLDHTVRIWDTTDEWTRWDS